MNKFINKSQLGSCHNPISQLRKVPQHLNGCPQACKTLHHLVLSALLLSFLRVSTPSLAGHLTAPCPSSTTSSPCFSLLYCPPFLTFPIKIITTLQSLALNNTYDLSNTLNFSFLVVE